MGITTKTYAHTRDDPPAPVAEPAVPDSAIVAAARRVTARCRELERALVGLAGEDLACEVHASTCRNCGRGLAHDEACDHGGKAAVRCVLCGCDIPWAELVTGQASGPRGVILHDGEVAHARCFQGAKERA